LDETGKEIVAGYVAYDRSTWAAPRGLDGDRARGSQGVRAVRGAGQDRRDLIRGGGDRA